LKSTAHIGNNGVVNPNQALEGLIDEVRIYDYALTPGEVLYLAGAGGYTLDPLATDLNLDGKVNLDDFLELSRQWLDSHLWPR